MDSIEISIEATEAEQEILISSLIELGADGFEQTDKNLVAYFSENNFNSYDIQDALTPFKYHIQNIPEQNWNHIWESNFEPVSVGEFCTIRAEFHKPLSASKYEIVITPKMSFGTGHHATTFMMIDQMSSIDFREKLVFDFGTGTGILAIMAEKLGARKILATDIDEWSIINTRENIQRNNCNKIEAEQTSDLPDHVFDIILANINRNIILTYLGELKNRLGNKGILLLSGLLESDKEEIVSACSQSSLMLIKQMNKNGWISLLFVN